MVREDLIQSAISFLQDPSVASSPLDKRIAFLRSKNLTQEEVDVALARVGDGNPLSSASPSSIPSNRYQQTSPPPNFGYSYGPYQGAPWMQPPLEPPRRDWRDWFIMATVTSGIGYGLYAAAQRYVLPLISPPTPPQLEQDKSQIDASFARAFALIDQLTADTAALQAAETARTEKLDATIHEIDNIVVDLKAANTRREAEARILADQVAGLKELVLRSLEGWKQGSDSRLEELSADVGSLKRLLEIRVGLSSSSASGGAGRSPATSSSLPEGVNGSPSATSASSSTLAPGLTAPKQDTSSTTSPSFSSSPSKKAGSRAIPAWQMAAANRKSNDGDDDGDLGASNTNGTEVAT